MKTRPVSIGEWLASARQFLADRLARRPVGHLISVDAAEQVGMGLRDAQVLLGHVLGKGRGWVIAHPEANLEPEQQTRLDALLERFVAGEPLPYLIGHWEFYGLDFEVTPAVLIPRPETELLVERGLDWLQHSPSRRTVDVGTGSGCIAISLAKQMPDLHVLAVDRSWTALEVARRNAKRLSVPERVRFLQSDLLSAATGPFDLVCANLPYIPAQTLAGLPVALYEPNKALDGGPDGLRLIRALLKDAPRWLAPGGCILLEMQYDQGEAITQMARRILPSARTTTHTDLAGLPRLIEIQDSGR